MRDNAVFVAQKKKNRHTGCDKLVAIKGNYSIYLVT